MPWLRELIAEFRELGPGALVFLVGALLLLSVLSLCGQVYGGRQETESLVEWIVAGAAVVAIILLGFGFWYVRRSVHGNLWDMGIMGRRFLTGEEVLKRIQEAKELVIVKTWFPEKDEIADALKIALDRGARVKLILCKPDSKILESRCEGAGFKLTAATKWISKGIDIVQKHAKYPEPLKHVRLHDRWPGCPVITADERIYMGFYFRGNTSPNFPWLEIRKRSTLAEYLKSQEDELWEMGVMP